MKVLIIGLGSIAFKHVQALKSIDKGVKIYALRSGFVTTGHPEVIDIYSESEISFSPSFVIISNPTSEHFSAISKALQWDCPLFIEKPSINKLENSEELLEIVERKKVLTYVACNLRFYPCLQFIKSKLNSMANRINEVNSYCGSYLPDWRPEKNYKDIYSSQDELGGGVHLDLIHELDYLYWFFGKPEKVNKILRNNSSLEINAIDYANYSLQYKGFIASVILNYYRRDSKRTLEILHDEGTFTVDLLENSVYFQGYKIFESPLTIAETYKIQMEYFLTCIANKQTTMNELKTSIEVLKICLPYE